jgi:hypothetical protein
MYLVTPNFCMVISYNLHNNNIKKSKKKLIKSSKRGPGRSIKITMRQREKEIHKIKMYAN